MEKLVSVIMPSYNTAKYIAESINSVLNQTYSNWELIIVDDCSSDETDLIVKSFLSDKRIKYYKNPTNLGAALSRNRGLREASGTWIAFLDSDDLWKPTKLFEQINYMETNNYVFSYTNYSEIDADGNELGNVISGPKVITRKGFYRYCWPGCLTVMYNRDVIGLIQIDSIPKNNDYAMWLQVSKYADCFLLDENLSYYRRGRSGSISNSNYFSLIRWHYLLFKDIDNRNAITSFFLTLQNLFFGVYKKVRYYSN